MVKSFNHQFDVALHRNVDSNHMDFYQKEKWVSSIELMVHISNLFKIMGSTNVFTFATG